MSSEKNNEEKRRTFDCCNCNEISEMLKGCFPDDAGFTACLAEINEGRKKFCGKKAEAAASVKKRSFCG
jgi:hypothetical protein